MNRTRTRTTRPSRHRADPAASKVLLLSMPMGAMERPALGLSYLKAQLVQRQIDCSVQYPAFNFVDMIGAEEYRWVSSELPYIAFAGDWCFLECLYGARPEADQQYLDEVLRRQWQLSETSIARLLQIRHKAEAFIEYCMQSIDWLRYSIVGFTSTFEQNIASLALAKRIKANYPHITIVFGGANWEGEMGLELHRQFPFVDYVCSGEADESFPALVQRLLKLSPMSSAMPTGVVFREAGESKLVGKPELIRQLDELPIPDYTDYFQQWNESSAALASVPVLLVETSRGCWWGNKSHCTFCGLNGSNMVFRSKTGKRAFEEMKQLSDRWQTDRLEVVDNILDMKYFQDLLPALASDGRPWQIFFEVKANLTRKHVVALKAAGIMRIQPGIESFNNHVLSLMGKGTTALRNIQLLKWCRELGIGVDWNLLYGFPGETAEDYQSMLAMLPSIEHLQPPAACGPVRMDRFSPYFEQADKYGLKNVRPMKPYAYLYPFSPASQMRIAYHFDFEYADDRPADLYAKDLIRGIDEWRSKASGCLTAMSRPDGSTLITDTRAGRQSTFSLPPFESAVYDVCDEVRSLAAIASAVHDRFPESGCNKESIHTWLQWLASHGLVLNDGDHWLSLAVRLPSEAPLSCAKPLSSRQADNANHAIPISAGNDVEPVLK